MRLCQMAGVADWAGMGRAMPDSIIEGWAEFEALEPSSADHFYEFFASAFVIICRALHDPETAGTVTVKSFKWWGDDPEANTLTDEQISDTARRWIALQADKSVPSPTPKQ